MASDLISRKELLSTHYDVKWTDAKGEVFVRLEDVGNWINSVPTVDAVEVVRCKDCKFNVANMAADSLDSTDYSDITCSYFMTDGMDSGDFCSRGEQMDGGDKE